jgi:hypothetical protein
MEVRQSVRSRSQGEMKTTRVNKSSVAPGEVLDGVRRVHGLTTLSL